MSYKISMFVTVKISELSTVIEHDPNGIAVRIDNNNSISRALQGPQWTFCLINIMRNYHVSAK